MLIGFLSETLLSYYGAGSTIFEVTLLDCELIASDGSFDLELLWCFEVERFFPSTWRVVLFEYIILPTRRSPTYLNVRTSEYTHMLVTPFLKSLHEERE
jgi:hypothetical protein